MVDIQYKQPKILTWDIETSPILAHVWGLYNQNIPISSIVKDGTILSCAFKWLHDDEIIVHSVGDKSNKFKKDPRDDKEVVKSIHTMLSAADILVAHYGDGFDMPYFTARAIIHKLPPLPPIKTVDTCKVAKNIAKFHSNKLDYIGQRLGLGAKMDTGKGMWNRVMEGDIDAMHHMEEYNKQDVLLTEELYLRLLPYMKQHPNWNLYTDNPVPVCPNCGSTHLQKRGITQTRVSSYQRYQCMDCGAWSKDGKAVNKFKDTYNRIR